MTLPAIPGRPGEYVVVEQKSRQIWRFDERHPERKGELFVDLSQESTTGEFDGVVCLAFHPDFANNRRYFVKYHLNADNEALSAARAKLKLNDSVYQQYYQRS